MSIAGTTVKCSNARKDMLLLQLNETPPIDYRPYMAGWNATKVFSGPAYCFHHPCGDVKKISIEYNTPLASSFTDQGYFDGDSHWRVYRWEEGITESGSSGSGLFDSDHRLLGGLSGGNPNISCSVPGDDNFFRISSNWESDDNKKSLKPWLDATNTGLTKMDGKELYNNPCKRVTNLYNNETLKKLKTIDGYAAGHNSYGILEFAERFSFNNSGTLHGIFFIPQEGIYSSSHPIKLQIYSGNFIPDKLLHEETIKITNKYYNTNSDILLNKTLIALNQKENYIRFNNPIDIDSSFFVVFSLPSVFEDTFALYQIGRAHV